MTARSLGPLTRDQVLERARKAIGQKTVYVLGQGGRDPRADHPGKNCDCSGFAAWVMGVDRYLPNAAIPGIAFGDWFETTALWKDARSPYGFVLEVPWAEALPGDLLVWPDGGGHQGHVGVCGSLGALGPETVIHCSMGNYRTHGDAIQETGALMFFHRHALVARVRWIGEVAA